MSSLLNAISMESRPVKTVVPLKPFGIGVRIEVSQRAKYDSDVFDRAFVARTRYSYPGTSSSSQPCVLLYPVRSASGLVGCIGTCRLGSVSLLRVQQFLSTIHCHFMSVQQKTELVEKMNSHRSVTSIH